MHITYVTVAVICCVSRHYDLVSDVKETETSGDTDKNYQYSITPHEGVCVPVNFGKRIGKDELYPIKRNAEGLCDYVLLKNVDIDEEHETQIVTSGILIKDGIKYGVYIDEDFIDLLPI